MTRGQFFLWYLPTVLLAVILKFRLVPEPYYALAAAAYLLSLPVVLIAAIRRSHDLGRGWAFALIMFIPFAGWYFSLKAGDPGENKHGPPPDAKLTPTPAPK